MCKQERQPLSLFAYSSFFKVFRREIAFSSLKYIIEAHYYYNIYFFYYIYTYICVCGKVRLCMCERACVYVYAITLLQQIKSTEYSRCSPLLVINFDH